jgi:hypothetical protein
MSIFFTLKQKFWKLWFFLCPKSATYLGLYLPLHGNNWQLLVWVVCSSSPHNDDGDDSAFFLAKIKCFSRCCTPLPQVTEHGLQAPKSEHSHSFATSTSAIYYLNCSICSGNHFMFSLSCIALTYIRLG